MTRAVIVGAGSIGQRHADVVAGLGAEVAVVSRRDVAVAYPAFRDLSTAVEEFGPDYVVLARETSARLPDLLELRALGYRGTILAEKPLAERPVSLVDVSSQRVAVGYNLRFHPLLARIRTVLSTSGPVVTASAYAGQHLSTWRPGTDYRSGYSADPERGGGVLRDLSHELDYLQWLFGPWRSVCAAGGNSGAIDVRSDDHWSLLLSFETCAAVGVQLNYLDAIGQRTLTIATGQATLHADFVGNTLRVNGDLEEVHLERNDTYRWQHEAVLRGTPDERLCGLEEAQRTLELIDAVERSARGRMWVDA